MSRKSRIAVMILAAVLVSLSICAVPGAMAKPRSHTVGFRVIKHGPRFDVVKGHAHRFRVKHHAHKVSVRRVGRFKVVRRTSRFVLLASSRGVWTPRPTITTPNSGDFIEGSPSKVTWKVSSAASSGYFRVSLKNTQDDTSTSLIASSVPAGRRAKSYSVPWTIEQPVGSYRVWVSYCSSDGTVVASDESDGIVSIVDAPVPTPTPTPTATPTSTPDPTPTSTPTPTPTSTPTPSPPPWTGAGPDPGTVYTNSGPLKLDNVHDVTYENVRFSGSSSIPEYGVITISGASYNITFRNSIIETNSLAAGGNGVTISDYGWGVHDITFDHCHFDYQPRMGFESISRRSDRGAGNWPGYLRVNLTNSTFDAQGSEAISYDDDDPAHTYNGQPQGAGYSTVSGNVVAGAGINSAYNWRHTFEINRTRNMTVTGNRFGPGVDGITNLRVSVGDPTNANWVFSGNTWDATAFLSGVTYKAGAQLWYMANVQGGVTVADTMLQGAPYSTGSWGYLDSVNGADFSGSTIHGMAGQLSSGMAPNSTNILWPAAQ